MIPSLWNCCAIYKRKTESFFIDLAQLSLKVTLKKRESSNGENDLRPKADPTTCWRARWCHAKVNKTFESSKKKLQHVTILFREAVIIHVHSGAVAFLFLQCTNAFRESFPAFSKWKDILKVFNSLLWKGFKRWMCRRKEIYWDVSVSFIFLLCYFVNVQSWLLLLQVLLND